MGTLDRLRLTSQVSAPVLVSDAFQNTEKIAQRLIPNPLELRKVIFHPDQDKEVCVSCCIVIIISYHIDKKCNTKARESTDDCWPYLHPTMKDGDQC